MLSNRKYKRIQNQGVNDKTKIKKMIKKLRDKLPEFINLKITDYQRKNHRL